MSKLRKKSYLILVILIFFLSLTLRFYRLNERWGFHYDQARDALVGLEAIKLGKIPLNGPFTSAGPFVFGPLFYYLIMFAYLILPNNMIAPQIFLSFLNSIFPLVMLKAGEIAYSKRAGLIIGLLAAISFNNIERAHILHPHNFIPFFSSLTLLFFVYFYKKHKLRYLFFFGVALGCALSLHYQALNLFWYLPFAFLTTKIKKLLTNILVFGFGFLIPSLPLLIWDYQRGWKNIANILDYFLIGQYRIWTSNRWLTYLGKFWPEFWSQVIGGKNIFGYIFIILSVFLIAYLLWKRNISRITFWISLIFFGQIFLLRYYRGEKTTMYLLYLVPLVIFISGFVINTLISINRLIGIILLAAVFGYTIIADISFITTQSNSLKPINSLVRKLQEKFPQKKYRLYVYGNYEPAVATMTSQVMAFKSLIDEKKGTKLGFSVNKFPYQQIAEVSEINPPVYIYELPADLISDQKNNILSINQEEWFEVSPSYIYSDIVEWWKVKEFKSYFSLTKYFQAKLFGKTF